MGRKFFCMGCGLHLFHQAESSTPGVCKCCQPVWDRAVAATKTFRCQHCKLELLVTERSPEQYSVCKKCRKSSLKAMEEAFNNPEQGRPAYL